MIELVHELAGFETRDEEAGCLGCTFITGNRVFNAMCASLACNSISRADGRDVIFVAKEYIIVRDYT